MSKMKNWLVAEWRITLHIFINVAIFAIPISTFTSLRPQLQSTPYGPLMLSIALTILSWFLYKAKKNNPHVRPADYGSDAYRKRRAIIIASALFGPAALSALENGSVLASLNPSDYWQAAYKESLEDKCQYLNKVIFNAAEEAQVNQNKYAMGIATTQEVQSSIKVLSVLAASQKQCIDEAASRRDRVHQKLKELSISIP